MSADIEAILRHNMQTDMSYVAICPGCQGVLVAVVDVPSMRRVAAKEMAKAIRQGELVSRQTVEEVRQMHFGCKCAKSGQGELLK